jgi:uncharacterized protein YfaT (DUF1175 family)
MPDALRLHSAQDRAAFRQWFWRLAEMQAEMPEAERAGEVQDCAALLRYAYREALKVHDAEWAETQHVGDVAFESVRQWRYPETMLGAGLFRVRPGPLVEGDEGNGAFLQFADAHALMSWNTYRVGRDLQAAKPGDLILYRQLGENSPYHSMVITGSDADWVEYHTGPIGGRRGEMRRMAPADLLRHPDVRWRPVGRIRTSCERSVGICCAKGSRAGLVGVCVAADDAYGIVCGQAGDVQPEHGEDVRSGREADDSPVLAECR